MQSWKRLKSVFIFLVLCVCLGCASQGARIVTQHINPATGTVDKVVTEETNPQIEYQRTQRLLLEKASQIQPRVKVRFEEKKPVNYYQTVETLNRSVLSEIAAIKNLLADNKAQYYPIDKIFARLDNLATSMPNAITTAFYTGASQEAANKSTPIIETYDNPDYVALSKAIERTNTTGEDVKEIIGEFSKIVAGGIEYATIGTVAVQGMRSLEETRPSNFAGGDITQSERSVGDVSSDRSNRPVDITEDSHNDESMHDSYNSAHIETAP